MKVAQYDRQYEGYRIFVGDLGSQICKIDLEREFERHGKISDIWMARNPPGFAFIVYKYADGAEKAVKVMETRSICGRRVRVEHAKPYSKGDRSDKGGMRGHSSRSDHHPARSHSKRRKKSRHRSRTHSRSRSRSPIRRSPPRKCQCSHMRTREISRDRERHVHGWQSVGLDKHGRSHSHERDSRERHFRRSNSRDSRDRHHRSRSRNRESSSDSDRRHRSRSRSRSRGGRRKSHSPEHDRWKRHQSDESSDDEHEEKNSMASVVKKKTPPGEKAPEKDNAVAGSKDKSLAQELGDESELASITLPPDGPEETSENKNDKNTSAKRNMDTDAEKKSDTPSESQKPKDEPDECVVSTDLKVMTDPVSENNEDERVKEEAIDTESDQIRPTASGSQTTNTESVQQKKDAGIQVEKTTNTTNTKEDSPNKKNKKKVETCSVETQTDFSHLESDVSEIRPTDSNSEEEEEKREMKEIATDTNLDQINVNNSQNILEDNRAGNTGSPISHVVKENTLIFDGTEVKSNSSDMNSNITISENEKHFVEDEAENEKLVTSDNNNKSPTNIIHTTPQTSDSVPKQENKIKIEYMHTKKRRLNGQAPDCFKPVEITKKLLPQTLLTNGKTNSWSAGILLSEQTSMKLGSTEKGISIKTM